MSEPALSYSPFYVKAWTILSILLGFFFLALFVFGDDFLHVGAITWNLLRYLARPLI
jgi:hypothetical protein